VIRQASRPLNPRIVVDKASLESMRSVPTPSLCAVALGSARCDRATAGRGVNGSRAEKSPASALPAGPTFTCCKSLRWYGSADAPQPCSARAAVSADLSARSGHHFLPVL
jgi:hypothetical protein